MTSVRRHRHGRVVAAFAGAAVLGAGAIGVLATAETTLQTSSQAPSSSTTDTGLQQTNSFGYIPQHETAPPTNGGPGAPEPFGGGPFGDGPFGNPAPPLPNGGPQLPAAAPVEPTLTTPAG
ncbi:hypothetical protein [Rhodococcus sp. ABRD24]|uniref:hypothetical protein n=1 Tax=Rhodococcus sp. ABRD24 TaxID=2507582 RepID=UPI001F604BB7|nr:hypothetical protein [Rhodococcus sp. ABRD24]